MNPGLDIVNRCWMDRERVVRPGRPEIPSMQEGRRSINQSVLSLDNVGKRAAFAVSASDLATVA